MTGAILLPTWMKPDEYATAAPLTVIAGPFSETVCPCTTTMGGFGKEGAAAEFGFCGFEPGSC